MDVPQHSLVTNEKRLNGTFSLFSFDANNEFFSVTFGAGAVFDLNRVDRLAGGCVAWHVLTFAIHAGAIARTFFAVDFGVSARHDRRRFAAGVAVLLAARGPTRQTGGLILVAS